MSEAMLDSRRNGEGGFTLIELLVVIIIIGVLAAVVIFAVGGTSEDAHEKACNADLRTLKTANELYATGFGVYATDEASLTGVGLLQSESELFDIGGTPADPTYPPQGATCA
jgi:general secretion pathway protein G